MWRPPQDREAGLEHLPGQGAQRNRERVRDERAGDVAVCRDLEGLREQLGRDHAADHPEDEERVAVERQPGGLTTSRR